MSDTNRLRPIERCILRLHDRGMADDEIGRRLHRSADFVRRVQALTKVPRTGGHHDDGGLRPLERCVLRWRDAGESYDDVGARLHRSPAFVEFIEELADYKLAR